MSNKSHSPNQPKVAIFNLFNLAATRSGTAVNTMLHASGSERVRRGRRATLSNPGAAGSHQAETTRAVGGSGRIAVLVENLTDAHTNKIISGIEAAAEETGLEIAILNILGKSSCPIALESFEGFIACCSDSSVVEREFFYEVDRPVIIVGNVEDAKGYPCVRTDYYRGAQLAVDHLINQGCEDILMIGSGQRTAAELDKYMGYRDALKASGKKWQEPLLAGQASVEAGAELATGMLVNGRRPDGVFITNDWIAAGFLKCLKKMEIGFPLKTAVIGFGNDSVCEMIEPGLCSIDFRKEHAGAAALKVLLEQINDPNHLTPNIVTVIEPALLPRVSSKKEA